MKIFVSEYVTGGGWNCGERPASLVREGDAMLQAVITDLLAQHDVTTTRDAILPPLPPHPRLTVKEVSSADEKHNVFDEQTRHADRVLVIAPEFDGILRKFSQRVPPEKWLGCQPRAIAVCSDKLQLVELLHKQGVPVIPTHAADAELAGDWINEPIVVKPRDGAGSLGVRYYRGVTAWRAEQSTCDARKIVQPFVPGDALSVAIAVRWDGHHDTYPVAIQKLRGPAGNQKTPFAYLGGVIPADISPQMSSQVDAIAQAVVDSIPGLAGYIGLDLIADPAGNVFLVEINPRLTTSYLGYRQLTADNLAMRWIEETAELPPIRWQTGRVEFAADVDGRMTER